MNRIAIAVIVVLLFGSPARAFFGPLGPEQRIAASSLIAVAEVTKVDVGRGVSEANVAQAVLGTRNGDRIEIWDDWQIDKSGGKSRISGRDPVLEVGRRYLVYLVKNEGGRLVTVQSSLDALEVRGEKVEREGEDGFEPLADKLMRIKAVLAKRKQGEP